MRIQKAPIVKIQKTRVNVIDFLNVFSDYREMKYLKMNIDFHKVKHDTLIADTFYFFEMFFGLYIEKLDIGKDENFIFIMKDITDYDVILPQIIEKYKTLKIKFITITDKFSDFSLEKSKDDFLCQYFYTNASKDKTIDLVLVSNDLYRDKREYSNKYITINTNVIKLNNVQPFKIDIDKDLIRTMLRGQFKRKAIPKYDLLNYL